MVRLLCALCLCLGYLGDGQVRQPLELLLLKVMLALPPFHIGETNFTRELARTSAKVIRRFNLCPVQIASPAIELQEPTMHIHST